MRRNQGGHRHGGFGGPAPPVKVGDELDVTIEAVGEKGDGIAKKDGFILFVPGVKEGEQVRIRVTRVLRKVGFADKIGKAGEASAEAPAKAPAEEAPAEIAEEPAPSAEDTETFGEEAPVEEAPEEPAEEKAPEEPSEEEKPSE